MGILFLVSRFFPVSKKVVEFLRFSTGSTSLALRSF